MGYEIESRTHPPSNCSPFWVFLFTLDKKGAPTELLGVGIDDPDKEILRLENSILTGIEPRIQNLSSKIVREHEKCFVVLRIGKSWNSPHRVNFKDHGKFYKRNSAGKYPMDVSELRIAFIQSEQIVDKIRKFRNDRVEKLKAEHELPVIERCISGFTFIDVTVCSQKSFDDIHIRSACMLESQCLEPQRIFLKISARKNFTHARTLCDKR